MSWTPPQVSISIGAPVCARDGCLIEKTATSWRHTETPHCGMKPKMTGYDLYMTAKAVTEPNIHLRDNMDELLALVGAEPSVDGPFVHTITS